MSITRLVAKNIFLLLLTRVILICISIIVIAKTSRYLGVGGFGEYNLVFTYLGFFTLFTDLGMSTIVIREMAANRERAGIILFNYIFIRIILITISIASLLFSIPFLTYPDSTKGLIVLAAIGPVLSILTPYEAVFHVTQKFKYSSMIAISIRLISASLILLVIFFKANVKWLIYTSILDSAINSTLAFYFGRRLIKAVPKIDFSLCRFIIVKSWPLAVSTVTMMIYIRFDQLLIAHFKENIDVGYYTAGLKIIEQFNMIPVFTVTVLFPLLSQLKSQTMERFIRISNLSFKYTTMIAIFFGVMLSHLSATIIILMYGRDFLPAQSPFIWLAWGQMIKFPNLVLGMMINIADRQKAGMFNSIFCAFLSISMNLYLIPLFGVSGAAFTYFLSDFIMFFLAVRIVKQYLPEFELSKVWSFLIGGASGWFIIYSMGGAFISIFLIFPLLYFGIIMLFKGFNRDDFRILRDIIIFKRGAVYVS